MKPTLAMIALALCLPAQVPKTPEELKERDARNKVMFDRLYKQDWRRPCIWTTAMSQAKASVICVDGISWDVETGAPWVPPVTTPQPVITEAHKAVDAANDKIIAKQAAYIKTLLELVKTQEEYIEQLKWTIRDRNVPLAFPCLSPQIDCEAVNKVGWPGFVFGVGISNQWPIAK